MTLELFGNMARRYLESRFFSVIYTVVLPCPYEDLHKTVSVFAGILSSFQY